MILKYQKLKIKKTIKLCVVWRICVGKYLKEIPTKFNERWNKPEKEEREKRNERRNQPENKTEE